MGQETRVETEQETQAIPPPVPTVERAELLMTKWGFGVGRVIGTTRHRLQNIMTSVRAEADRIDQPKPQALNRRHAASTKAAQEKSVTSAQNTEGQVTVRAEQLVDDISQRVGAFMLMTSYQLRRAGAFVREDAEDIWAEAQSIRNQRKQPSTGSNYQASK